jgi:sec-independent protein translocase protein TatC
MFGATIGLAMQGGKATAFPVLTVGLLWLLKPLVPSRFWWFITIYTALIIGFFLTGVSFVYYVMMPVSLGFLLTFGDGIAVPVILLTEYVALLTSLMLWIGLIFLLPIVMNLLARVRLVSYQRARKLHKWVPWVALILAALITPSLDGLLTMLVAVPMYLLYLVGLFAAWLVNPEEGNYLWFWTIRRSLRHLRDRVVWVVRRPVVMIRWVRWKIWQYGSGWWWD